ncbi:hypothetical protein L1987_08289 [Smallanthus sonchifolius]|uniref:Uncharacterized protein n=1 Tax=Smallanthus sonchifolius TaxID=185202 RepID=A0ACB9JM07_9ASTR|nr:hypothetical protein L1987_08289 [Smallanthus sonchifolius]
MEVLRAPLVATATRSDFSSTARNSTSCYHPHLFNPQDSFRLTGIFASGPENVSSISFLCVRILWLQSWQGLWCNLPAFLLQFQVKAKSVQSDLVIQKEQSR